jgi:hypothetical protein
MGVLGVLRYEDYALGARELRAVGPVGGRDRGAARTGTEAVVQYAGARPVKHTMITNRIALMLATLVVAVAAGPSALGGQITLTNGDRISGGTTLDLFGGATVNRELFSAQSDRLSGEALVGQELSHKLTPRVTIKQRLAFYPNLTQPGEFRLNVDTTAVTPIAKWVGLQVTVSNRHVSGPIAPARNNDVLVTTGLRFTFAD